MLTNYERVIVRDIARRPDKCQIAEEMFSAEKTVKNYVSNLLAKMGMSRRSEAAAYGPVSRQRYTMIPRKAGKTCGSRLLAAAIAGMSLAVV